MACLSGLPWFVRESAPLEHLSDLRVADYWGNNAFFAGMNQLKKITGKEVWLRVAGGVVEAY